MTIHQPCERSGGSTRLGRGSLLCDEHAAALAGEDWLGEVVKSCDATVED